MFLLLSTPSHIVQTPSWIASGRDPAFHQFCTADDVLWINALKHLCSLSPQQGAHKTQSLCFSKSWSTATSYWVSTFPSKPCSWQLTSCLWKGLSIFRTAHNHRIELGLHWNTVSTTISIRTVQEIIHSQVPQSGWHLTRLILKNTSDYTELSDANQIN